MSSFTVEVGTIVVTVGGLAVTVSPPGKVAEVVSVFVTKTSHLPAKAWQPVQLAGLSKVKLHVAPVICVPVALTDAPVQLMVLTVPWIFRWRLTEAPDAKPWPLI